MVWLVAELRQALQAIADECAAPLPGYLPQLDSNLRTTVPESDETVWR